MNLYFVLNVVVLFVLDDIIIILNVNAVIKFNAISRNFAASSVKDSCQHFYKQQHCGK